MSPSPDQPDSHEVSPGGDPATLTCPDCHTTLQTAADQSVEAPCPVCGTLLRYEAPTRAKLAPFQPLHQHSHRHRREDGKKPKRSHTHRTSLRERVHKANEFINSPPGMLATCVALCLLLVFCVVLFFKWDRKRRAAALRAQSPPPVEAVRPAKDSRPAPANPVVPVNLPAVEEPDPDPFALPPDQVIEAPAGSK